jgi:hypothetical protein
MRKSVQLVVTVEVEGEHDTADDFTRRAISAVRDAIKVGRARHPNLIMTVHKVAEDPTPA